MVPLKHAAPARSASKVRALAATIREDDVRAAALRTLARNGFRVSPAAVRAETGSWERLGLELRDTVFPARTRALLGGDATDIRSADETLWERLPRVAGFAYRHAEVLGGLQRAPPSSTSSPK